MQEISIFIEWDECFILTYLNIRVQYTLYTYCALINIKVTTVVNGFALALLQDASCRIIVNTLCGLVQHIIACVFMYC